LQYKITKIDIIPATIILEDTSKKGG